MTNAAIERQGDKRLATIDRVFGSGDMQQMIEETRSNVHAAIAFAEEREFVTRYPIVRRGKQVGERLWFHHPTWQLLGQSFGITAYTEGEPKEIKPGTWQASAVAATIEDGRVVGRAVGLTSRSEPGKEKNSDHSLQANSQTRAQRNALRSALGAVLIAAGFEIVDPEGPSTQDQWGVLHQLAREIGWDKDQAHIEAGVLSSFKDLDREEADELIERWTALRDNSDAVSPHFPASDTGESGSSSVQGTPGDDAEVLGEGAEGESSGGPDLDRLWHQAIAAGLTVKKVVPFAKANGIKVNQAYELDAEQMTVLLTKWQARPGH